MPKGKRTRIKPCAHCGVDFVAISSFMGVYCSYDCKAGAARKRLGVPEKTTKPKNSGRRRRLSSRGTRDNIIAVAVKSGDRDAILAAIRSVCLITETGCWIPKPEYADYPHQAVPSYQVVWLGTKAVGLHRLALETAQGLSLGHVHCHHICAVRVCCNPDHLQPATQIDNTLEMRERHAYRRRIADLERALKEVAPDHPALWPDRFSESVAHPLTLF